MTTRPYRRRRVRWTIARSLWAVPMSVFFGFFLATWTLIGMVIGTINDPSMEVDPFTVMKGAPIAGVLLSPALMLVAASRSAVRGMAFAGIILNTPVALLSGAVDASMGLGGASLGVTAAAYVAVCLVWRRVFGAAGWVEIPGLCPSCGYDLAGLAAPVCPECGEPIGDAGLRG